MLLAIYLYLVLHTYCLDTILSCGAESKNCVEITCDQQVKMSPRNASCESISIWE